jgi:GT2 family glycosyltransferase
MKLSVVIVSYNVRYFLEKCIASVVRAMDGIQSEIIVVDNHSSDKSVEMLSIRFPEVICISNQDNRGFAVACNQGLQISTGEYALLLNPDTLVSEDTFHTCIDFMDTHHNAAACGVRMVDGTGRFLPESWDLGIGSDSMAHEV